MKIYFASEASMDLHKEPYAWIFEVHETDRRILLSFFDVQNEGKQFLELMEKTNA